MFKLILFICIFITCSVQAQIFQKKEEEKRGIRLPKYVATKNTFGMIAGIERGQYTFLELGAEKHWKKIRLVHAQTIGANANMEYSFGNNILGYNAAAWVKTGRVNLTYGINLNYITDFEKSRYGLGPQIGFRLLGLHFVNGYNFLLGNRELTQVNKFYVGLRYYFPVQSKTTVVNVNRRTPAEKERQKAKVLDNKSRALEKNTKNTDSKSGSEKRQTSTSKTMPSTKKGKKKEPEVEVKKHPFDIFKKKQAPSQSDNKTKKGKKADDGKMKKGGKEAEKKNKLWDYFKNNE